MCTGHTLQVSIIIYHKLKMSCQILSMKKLEVCKNKVFVMIYLLSLKPNISRFLRIIYPIDHCNVKLSVTVKNAWTSSRTRVGTYHSVFGHTGILASSKYISGVFLCISLHRPAQVTRQLCVSQLIKPHPPNMEEYFDILNI